MTMMKKRVNCAPTRSLSSPTDSIVLPKSTVSSPLRLLAYPLFFASGMAGLVYEIVWTRMLLTIFGANIYAVSAVLSAFMAGLALGSLLLGKAGDRLRYPFRFYAMLEIMIGAAGFILPMILRQTAGVDGWVYARWGDNFAVLTFGRFLTTFLILLIPTTLMGATLPVLSKALVHSKESLGLRVGELYAINTAGAVLGAFVAGFYWIGKFGVLQTEFTAAILNVFAASGAYAISVVTEKFAGADQESEISNPQSAICNPQSAIPETLPYGRGSVKAVLWAALASGAVSMAAQVIWSRALIFQFEYLKNTTYAFSAMLTIFLTGLALGSALAGLFADRVPNPLRFYGLILALIGVAMACSVNVLHQGAGIGFLPNPLSADKQALNWPMAVGNIMAQSAMVLGVPTLLMGMAFPLAVRSVGSDGGIGAQVGRLYAFNTVGCILGPLVACFAIVPILGLSWGLMLLAAGQSLVGLVLLHNPSHSHSPSHSPIPIAILTLAAFLLLVFVLPRHGGMQVLDPGQSLEFYEEGPMATVSVVRDAFGYRTINVDGVGVAGTDPMLQTDQKSLAHLPMFLVTNPKSALTVGFGSGGASYSYLLHDRLEKVHCVEICPEVLHAAPHLQDANHGLLEKTDRRYRVIFDDARAYLTHTRERYDIIATDCTDLRYKSNANLYDLEYFEACRERLNPGGVVVVWMPLAGLSDAMFRVALRTFYRVFPNMGVFYLNNEPTHYILLVGWRDEMTIDPRLFELGLRNVNVKSDLAELFLDDSIKLISTFVTGGDAMKDYLVGDEINTENRPRLEFESPKYGYGDQPILDNLNSLLAIRVSARNFYPTPTDQTKEVLGKTLADLDQYEAALTKIIEGHAHYRKLEMEAAARDYLAASALAPKDSSLKNLLGFRELRLGFQLHNPWSAIMLGRVYQIQGMNDQAVSCLRDGLGWLAEPRNDFERGLLKNAENWIQEMNKMHHGDTEK